MIIGATRIRTGSKQGPWALIRHVFHGSDNEDITVIQGGKHDVVAAHADAQAAGRTYSNRHFSISPEEATTREEAREVFQSIADEFGFNLDDATLVEHHKARQDGRGYERHWHVMVPEQKPDGSTLDSRFMMKRHEKLGRLAEIRLGHDVTKGKHDQAVLKAMEKDGLPEARAFAEVLRWREFGPGAGRPRESYSADTHQILKKNGVKTPAVKAAVSLAWAARDDESCLPFNEILHACGIDLTPGRRAGAWVASVNGVEVTALHRLLKVKQREVEVEMGRQKIAPAWCRATGGYDALSTQNKKKAEAGFGLFRQVYEKSKGVEYPYGLSDYVAYCQQQEARKPYHVRRAESRAAARQEQAAPAQAQDEPDFTVPSPAERAERALDEAAAEGGEPDPSHLGRLDDKPARPQAQPKSLPLPDDPAALRRLIGESPWSQANRDPARLFDATRAQVQAAKEKAANRLARAEAAVERTAPRPEIVDGKALAKLADAAIRLTIRLANVVLRPLGIPITYKPSLGGPRIIGEHPGDPRAHEAAHREADKIREHLTTLPGDDVIRAKADAVAAARQEAHDEWADRTAPARLKLSEIQAREEAEKAEMERRAKAKEARMAAAVAAQERAAAQVDVPELGPDVDVDVLDGLRI
jgi:hypothetical protein